LDYLIASQRILDPEQSLPAVGQGALGIECRADRDDLVQLLQPLHHMETAYCVEAERSMSRVLGGSCQVPLGAFAEIIDGTLQLRGFVAQPDGTRIVSDALNGKPETGIKMGQELAEKLIKQGADEILASLVPAEGWK
jgi:hydroxymethylbilane synthase